MKKLFIFYILLTASVFGNSTENEQKQLEYALTNSQIFEQQNITSQVGTLSTYSYSPKYTNSFFAPFGTSNIQFGGIGKHNSTLKPKIESIESSDDSPAFMFIFEKKGDSFSIGGDIRGVDMNYFNNYFNDKK